MFKAVDTSGKGSITFEDFQALMGGSRLQLAQLSEEELKEAFQMCCRNNSLSPTQLLLTLANFGEPLSEEDLADLIKGSTRDENGNISFEEFLKLV